VVVEVDEVVVTAGSKPLSQGASPARFWSGSGRAEATVAGKHPEEQDVDQQVRRRER
jgi:hypothetical protein